jgi:serine protease
MGRIHTLLYTTLLLLFTAKASTGQQHHPHFFDGQLYVKFKNHIQLPIAKNTDVVELEALPELKRLAAEYGITRVRASFYFARQTELRQTLRVYFQNAQQTEEFIRTLEKWPAVDYAERVPLHKTSVTPNDLGANNTSNTGQWYLHRINAQAAWDIATGSSTIRVAVVDDAVQTTHPDLNDVCVPGRDVSDNDNNPNPPDNTFSHGTHVAGIVGAETNNGTGIASIGFGISIIPVKATNEVEFITDGYEGVTWAINNGADVINMSWGGSGGSQTGQNIMNAGNTAGVVLVAAAGNDDVSTVFYPAGFNHVISVASTASSDAKSSFSNFGTWIDIASPGSAIRSTLPSNTYGVQSGTSMASPLVAGLCGLMLSVNPNLSPAEVLECLQITATNINGQNSNYIGQLGAGRINAQAALECASASVLTFDASLQAITAPSGSTCNTGLTPAVTFRNTGQNAITSLVFLPTLDGVSLPAFTWTGNLQPQNSLNITLPAITTGIGAHTLTICTSTMNGNQPDLFGANNCRTVNFTVVSPIGTPLPFTENFESGGFTTNGWTVQNPDNSLSWEVINTQGTAPGNTSARVPFFSYTATGERDGLISRTLNFSGYSTITMSFEHAYRRYEAGQTDSLIVSVSTDCGSTYTRVFSGGESGQGSFATQTISTTDFLPASSNDWCMGTVGSDCVTLDLTPFAGASGVRVKFESFNNYGNNLYIDNINITGVVNGAPPTADFALSQTAPVCAGTPVLFTNLSSNLPNSYTWTFEGGTPATSTQLNPTIVYSTPGTYSVSLLAGNAFGTDTETRNGFITVIASPNLTVSASPSAICAGKSATLSASGALEYEWSPVLAVSDIFGESIIVAPPTSTVYTVTGVNEAGCEASAQVSVQINPVPASPVITQNSNGALEVAPFAGNIQWFLNGEAVVGANSAEFVPSAEGNYTVTFTNAQGCTSTSLAYNFNPSNITEGLDKGFSLFPNPSKGHVRLVAGNYWQGYRLMTAEGKLVETGMLQGAAELNWNLSAGMYFVQLFAAEAVRTERVIVIP